MTARSSAVAALFVLSAVVMHWGIVPVYADATALSSSSGVKESKNFWSLYGRAETRLMSSVKNRLVFRDRYNVQVMSSRFQKNLLRCSELATEWNRSLDCNRWPERVTARLRWGQISEGESFWKREWMYADCTPTRNVSGGCLTVIFQCQSNTQQHIAVEINVEGLFEEHIGSQLSLAAVSHYVHRFKASNDGAKRETYRNNYNPERSLSIRGLFFGGACRSDLDDALMNWLAALAVSFVYCGLWVIIFQWRWGNFFGGVLLALAGAIFLYVITDAGRMPCWLQNADSQADHQTVNHSDEEYVRYENGATIHTNTIEGYFSIFKRGMKGVYQHCSEKHLHRYLAEFDFRYNNRSAKGVEDVERTERALRGIKGKRLTYRRSYGAAEGLCLDDANRDQSVVGIGRLGGGTSFLGHNSPPLLALIHIRCPPCLDSLIYAIGLLRQWRTTLLAHCRSG